MKWNVLELMLIAVDYTPLQLKREVKIDRTKGYAKTAMKKSQLQSNYSIKYSMRCMPTKENVSFGNDSQTRLFHITGLNNPLQMQFLSCKGQNETHFITFADFPEGLCPWTYLVPDFSFLIKQKIANLFSVWWTAMNSINLSTYLSCWSGHVEAQWN